MSESKKKPNSKLDVNGIDSSQSIGKDKDNKNDKPADVENPNEKKLVPSSDLDKMVAECMRDVGSDDESDDESDPDLLDELKEITGEVTVDGNANESEVRPQETVEKQGESLFIPTSTANMLNILKERIHMYEVAEETAQTSGEESRVRRFSRGLKTLKDLLKQVNSGKNINIDDIPPEVSMKGAKKDSEDECNTTNGQAEAQEAKTPSDC